MLYVEAVARVIKNHLFEKLRKKMEEVKLPLEAPYRKVNQFFLYYLFDSVDNFFDDILHSFENSL